MNLSRVRMSKWLWLVFVGALCLISLQYAKAQDTNTITLNVSPTVIELDANRNDLVEGSFKVINGSDIDLKLTTTPKNFTASDEVGGVNITEDDTSYSLADWISVTPQVANVAARGSQVFNYSVQVPENAEPGGHFGAIIVNTEALRVDLTGPAVVQEVGPLILVKVPGETVEEASIVEFKTADSFLEKGPVTFETRVKNTGNIHFKPKGTIEIKNMFGQVVTTIGLEERNVLPESIRLLTNDWGPDGFTIGRYTANLTIVYGIDNQIVNASTSFVLMPYKTILPILIILIIVVTFSIRNRKRIKKALSVLKNG